MEPLLTTRQAAQILNIPESTLRYWRSIGVGPTHIKLEKLVRYDIRDLEKYSSQGRFVSSVRAPEEGMRERL